MMLLTLLKQKTYFFLAGGLSLLLFDVGYWFMSTFPGERDFMCTPGASITLVNISYTLLYSTVISIQIVGIIELIKRKTFLASSKSGSLTGLSLILAILNSICTLCTLPVLSLFGISISLGFMTFYAGWFKLVSIIILMLSLYIINKQLTHCHTCTLYKSNLT